MAAIHRIGIVAANLLLAAQSLVVLSIGGAMAPTVFLWGTAPTAQEPWIEALRAFHVKMAVTFLAAGAAVCVLHLRGGWRQRSSAGGGGRITVLGWLLVCCLAILPVCVLASSAPGMSLWREGVELLDSLDVWQALQSGNDPLGLSGLLIAAVLLVPGLELGTAVSFLIASVAVLLLLWAGTHHTIRVLIQCSLVQGAFLFATFHSIEVFDRLSGPMQQLLSGAPNSQSTSAQAWVLQRQERAKLMARNLSWQFVGYLFLAPISVLAAGRAPLEARAQADLADLDQRERLAAAPAYQSLNLAARERRWRTPGGATAGDGPPPDLRHLDYVVRSIAPALLTLLPGPHAYEISGPAFGADERVLFRTARSGSTTRIEKQDGGAVVSIRSKGSLLPAVFEVFAANGRLLGRFKRDGRIRPTWLLFDDQDRRIGASRLVALDIGYAKYEIDLQGQAAATLTWCLHRLLRPEIIVDFAPDQNGRLDKRLGLALAVVLESKARFWAQVRNS